MKKDLFGYSLFSGTIDSCAAQIASTVFEPVRACRTMMCLNPHSFVSAETDEVFQRALRRADWLVPDGIGIVMASKIMGSPLQGRITGPDLFSHVMESLNKTGGSVFFLGASRATLEDIESRLSEVYPNISLAGTYSPPFKPEFSPEDNAAMIAAVNAARPDILWVGMTAPKQEKWLEAHHGELDVKFAGAVGAVFDFFAGSTKRAPSIMRRVGLEWLHRSFTSPGRLGKRNATSNPKFVIFVLRSRFARHRY